MRPSKRLYEYHNDWQFSSKHGLFHVGKLFYLQSFMEAIYNLIMNHWLQHQIIINEIVSDISITIMWSVSLNHAII